MGIKSRIVAGLDVGRRGARAATCRRTSSFRDLRMPGSSGMTIYRELLAERPELARRFVLVTGDLIGAKAEIEALPAAAAAADPGKAVQHARRAQRAGRHQRAGSRKSSWLARQAEKRGSRPTGAAGA